MTLAAELSTLLAAIENTTAERPWNDHRIKFNEIYVGMGTSEDAKFIEFCYANRRELVEGLKAREKFPPAKNCALLSRATKLFATMATPPVVQLIPEGASGKQGSLT